jgi:hypothetical protein
LVLLWFVWLVILELEVAVVCQLIVVDGYDTVRYAALSEDQLCGHSRLGGINPAGEETVVALIVERVAGECGFDIGAGCSGREVAG